MRCRRGCERPSHRSGTRPMVAPARMVDPLLMTSSILPATISRASTVVAPNEFVKSALGSVGGVLLVEECQLLLLEFFEEVVPTDLAEILVLGLEVEPQDTGLGFAAGADDGPSCSWPVT